MATHMEYLTITPGGALDSGHFLPEHCQNSVSCSLLAQSPPSMPPEALVTVLCLFFFHGKAWCTEILVCKHVPIACNNNTSHENPNRK